jgi:hypothetical protein
MRFSYVLAVLISGIGATAAFAEGAVGSAMENCEKNAIVKNALGATGRILSDMGGVCLVGFPNGTEGVIPGGSSMYPPGALIRQAALNEVAESGVVLGNYVCTAKSGEIAFTFELAGDGTYTLQESAGRYENPDRNSISFSDGDLDAAVGWMNKGVIGLKVPDGEGEVRCVSNF